MKIVMLGYSGTGKSSLIASMYGKFQASVAGVSLSTESKLHSRLVKTYEQLQKGVYPPLTTYADSIDMKLYYEGNYVMPFEMIDYRGGILTELEGSAEQEEVLNNVASADAVILFIDSYSVYNDKYSDFETAVLSNLLSSALGRSKYRKSVAIVFTKYDKVDHDYFWKVKEPFEDLIDNLFQSKNAVTTIYRTAVGKKMLNVEFPMAFSLWSIAIDKYNQVIAEHNKLVQEYNEYNNKVGIGDWIYSKLNGMATYAEMRDSRQEQMQEKKSLIKKVQMVYNSLDSYIHANTFPDFVWKK